MSRARDAIVANIARALGSAYTSGDWWRCRCPAHASRNATLALRGGDRGLVVYCHAGCDRREILAELRRLGLLNNYGGSAVAYIPDRDEMERRREAEAADRYRRIALALDIWGTSYPAPGTIVESYLRSRGIPKPLPTTLRMHGALGPYGRHHVSGDRRPQMLGLVEHVEHGAVGVHRTFLAIDGSQKATLDPQRVLHGLVAGGAVRLGSAGPTLAVTEGIENGLAVLRATGIPTWAALSASGLRTVILPAEARMVLVAADNDENGVGQRAAYDAASRFRREGRRVKIIIPPEPNTDWNDALCGRAPAHLGQVHHGA
jgi:putative DNA primase/helicase